MSWKIETGAIAAYVIGTLSITSDWWSMAFTQLSPELPVTVIGKGDGLAFAVIDYGEEQNLIWVVALDDSGEIWCSPNPIVRMRANWTMGRKGSARSTSPDQCAKNDAA